MDFDTSEYIYYLLLPLFKNYKLDPIRIIYVEIDKEYEIYGLRDKNNITFNNKLYKISISNFNSYDSYYLESRSKKILIESYFLYKQYLVYTGYIFKNIKNNIDDEKEKEKFMKSINENTTLRYKLSGLNLLKCNIDWNIFTKANVKILGNDKEIYNLKSLPNDFSNILNKSKESIWQIELNTPLNIDYINISKKLAFAMGLHKRLGKESILLLVDDVLKLILNKC
jgi:hypothetical protein